MKKKTAVLTVTLMMAGLMTACGGSKPAETTAAPAAAATEAAAEAETKEEKKEEAAPAEEVHILVAAAASLKNAYENELIPMFQEKNPGIIVEGTYDSSGKLQKQIEEGLEADVFMSAANKQMKALDEEGMIASDTIEPLLENKIVLIVPAGSDSALTSFEDIVNAESIALGDPESVPAGQYAKEALTNLGVYEEIQPKVSFGTNVTEVLNQVAAASADAGIVYATDAASMSADVTIVAEAPEGSLKTRVIYPLAVLKGSAHADSAQAFVDFLGSDEAVKVFESYGFSKN